MDRIWHPYWLWEDYKNGFYKSECEYDKEKQIELSQKLFENTQEFKKILKKVVDEWQYSCEHNLTNESMNKIAYLGQAACAYKYKISNDISREGYNNLTKKEKLEADKIAEKIYNRWLTRYLYNKEKSKQAMLFDLNTYGEYYGN